jgi:ABC-type multidrug transport system fused ATPase/permease subunit
MFANLSDQYFLGKEAFSSIKELLNEPAIELWSGQRVLHPIHGKIEFDHVTFAYPETTRNALTDFTLTIQPGEKIALVGPSGAGKSTITNLLLGLYAPTSGQIVFDGVRQADLNIREFRRHTAIVMQESILLSGTIEDNIRFAKDDATDAEVQDAARGAQADEFIQRLPEGLKTIVGERGVMLSGGQRQRIAIARALLRDPAILLLDEPTSALDYESERLIQQALEDLVKGRTVITIAHRLSTIRNADRVVVLQEGQIVEVGTFAELSALDGHFAKMLAAQELGTIDEKEIEENAIV